MKSRFILIILIFLNNCSFDTKSGIWKSDNVNTKKKDDIFKDFENVSISDNIFDKIILLKNSNKIKISPAINNLKWQDIYFSDENNLKNFKFSNLKKINFKSKKLTREKVNNYLIFENDNLIIADEKGNIIVFSIKEKRIISKYNFYRKKYKGQKKKLNLYVENNIIYVSDNLGYLYSFNYKINKIIWAKNYKIPFRSNIKISFDKIICSDANNNLVFFNKINGEILKSIPTENSIITNDFGNNISINNNNLFYLNSYGSLYSGNIETMNLNWFINLNPSLNLKQSSLFNGREIINNGSKIIVSSNKNTYLIEADSGRILKKFNFSSTIKPIINNNIAFFLTKNSFLIAVDLLNPQILYSQDVNLQVAKFLDSKKKSLSFKDMKLLNDEIYIFLDNSFILNFKNNGQLNQIKKLPSKINTFPIVIDSSILYLNLKKKLIVVN